MIEIVVDKERNLKNVKQIGTPKDEDKIYVENLAYMKIKEDGYKEKRIFVLMGHSERMQGRYATFVEAAIPIRDVEFIGSVPCWNNAAWGEAYREIRRLYEDMIIVGWAIDIKGMSPKMSVELERVHREHFGGVHQVLFLLDTLEQEESFYVYKENKLVEKDGFYIYYHARRKSAAEFLEENRVQIKPIKPVEVEVDIPEQTIQRRGQYRQLLQEQQKKESSEGGNMGLAIAVAMLVFVIGVGAYENRDTLFKIPDAIETNAPQENDTDADVSAKNSETEETGGESYIPVENVSGDADKDDEVKSESED